ncbi:hypothetical protein J416_05843 [Gracilibacillus halophilus YIM-C55.5]|uniref:Uncharacterized protein n=1 Tax=Gracilibacillus halophilus YIM-C55.5 TaxID=1308866 RepID=N4WE44_9BACI|nr:hypothetical protein [Gracilibacillus halophilus]ENH97509.1 hypothetical protein J416_05843 [Gracilibacillus halophilus YIM-C55.5]
MDELLGIIIPILTIGAWLLSLMKNADEQEEKPVRPKQTSSSPSYETIETEPELADVRTSETTDEPVFQSSYEEQRQAQAERLKEKYEQSKEIQAQSSSHDAILEEGTPVAYKKDESLSTSLSIQQNLTKKGITQGIIMAEVLGPPRAHQKRLPHRNK